MKSIIRDLELSNKEELLKESLKKAHENQDLCNSFVTIIDDAKLKKEVDSPLCNIPYVLKDNYSTKGILTTGSSNTLKDYIPPYNSTVYEKLENAGAIMIAKSVLDEFGMKTDNIDDRAKEFLKEQKKIKKKIDSFEGKPGPLKGDAAEAFQNEAYEVLMTQIAVTNIMQQNIMGFVGIIYMAGKLIIYLLKKSERRKLQYKYAIVLFYKRYIHEFLKIDEKNIKETSEKMDF